MADEPNTGVEESSGCNEGATGAEDHSFSVRSQTRFVVRTDFTLWIQRGVEPYLKEAAVSEEKKG